MSNRTVEEVIAELTEITEGVAEDKKLLKAVQTHLTNFGGAFQSDWEDPNGDDEQFIRNRPLLPEELIDQTLNELNGMLQALRQGELTLMESLCEIQSTIQIVNHLIPTIESYKNGLQCDNPQEGNNPVAPPQS